MKNDFLRLAGGLALGLLLCFVTGVFWEGVIFVGTAFFSWLPKLPRCRWYEAPIGALSAGVTAALAGDSAPVFWGLFAVAAAALSLKSPVKTVLLSLAAFATLKLDINVKIYAAMFIGVIWNAILAFTYSEIYAKIELD